MSTPDSKLENKKSVYKCTPTIATFISAGLEEITIDKFHKTDSLVLSFEDSNGKLHDVAFGPDDCKSIVVDILKVFASCGDNGAKNIIDQLTGNNEGNEDYGDQNGEEV